ncbi:MAG TPA: isoleucine--tRNA ligase [Kofleriaceae bacterium]|jgi:isoleucyl-tRNA synthetase
MSSSGQSKYKDTVLLPETEFPMRAELATREPEILAEWEKNKLYGQIQEARKTASPFIFHDGPPYSNGHIHYGHILNKTLKDIVVKSHVMAGFRAPFVPGWDTHGLPIELAVERELKDKRASMSAAEFRTACKEYALKFVDIQRAEFKRLGVLADWEHPYLTLDASFEGAIAKALAVFTRKGFLYRSKKPVSWCYVDKTALAEAEVEYKDKTSPSVYVKFPLVDRGQLPKELEGKKLAYVIWTTTPWTLPANLAIVAHPQFTYIAVPNPKDPSESLIVAKELAEAFVKAIGGTDHSGIEITPAQMKTLEGGRYQHPFVRTLAADLPADKVHRLWFADYVTADTGTGLVHTAPGHGADDYKTGNAHGLPAYAPLDDAGRYTQGVALEGAGAPVDLTGKHTTKEANPIIIEWLATNGYLLNPRTDTIKHSYQHCWRCKQPIIFRATPQWFISIDHEGLRTKALAAIRETEWVPEWGENRIYAMIENRPDWVLSRQRLWGTPIPAFYCTGCGGEHADADTMDHIADIFAKEGADAWWTRSVAELVPAGTKCKHCGQGADKLEREKDIVDVWFESGVSWLAMQNRPDGADYKQIDVYLEGSDQHRGWFHSSLLAGIGVKDTAPYREVITHGFVVDSATGKPYSKSDIEKAKAQGIDIKYLPPEDIIKKSGAELFRLWVGSTEYRNDIPYSQTILYGNDGKGGLSEWYRKFRNTARFLLGNVNPKDFDPNKHSRADVEKHGQAVDKYVLARIDDVVARARKAYESYELHIVHRLLVELITIDLSALYGDVTKDRLYSDAANSGPRRAAQVVMYEAVRAIATLSAPVLSFTAEDIWRYMPKLAGDPDSVHLAAFPDVKQDNAAGEIIADFAVLLAWRERATKALEPFRATKKKSVDASVVLRPAASERGVLERYKAELADLFIVSAATIGADGDGTVEVTEHTGLRCERCWKHYDKLAAEPNDVCERCATALKGA